MVKPLAADAVKDLLVFLEIANDRPDAALALGECLELGLPIVVCHPDRDETVIAGKPRFRCELNERLARYLPTFQAGQIVDGAQHDGQDNALRTPKLGV